LRVGPALSIEPQVSLAGRRLENLPVEAIGNVFGRLLCAPAGRLAASELLTDPGDFFGID
jgi:hypothetical protein